MPTTWRAVFDKHEAWCAPDRAAIDDLSVRPPRAHVISRPPRPDWFGHLTQGAQHQLSVSPTHIIRHHYSRHGHTLLKDNPTNTTSPRRVIGQETHPGESFHSDTLRKDQMWSMSDSKCTWYNYLGAFHLGAFHLVRTQFNMLSEPTHPLFACNTQWKCIGGLTPPTHP